MPTQKHRGASHAGAPPSNLFRRLNTAVSEKAQFFLSLTAKAKLLPENATLYLIFRGTGLDGLSPSSFFAFQALLLQKQPQKAMCSAFISPQILIQAQVCASSLRSVPAFTYSVRLSPSSKVNPAYKGSFSTMV